MSDIPQEGNRQERPSFAELFTPKLVTVLREGYGLEQLRADMIAGLTVAIVALPLSMAIAIASHVEPARGLYTGIVGGFLVGALGGSRFQIGGPAGAFIVLVASTVDRHGVDGLILATLIAGMFLIAAGYLRLGTYIKFIPYPVTVGFTAGIAVIILSSQMHDLFGLTLPGKEPGDLVPRLIALTQAAGTFNPAAVAIAALTIAVIVGLKRWRPSWPGFLVAVGAASLAVILLQLPVATIGSQFGGIPRTLPQPALPTLGLDKMAAVLPDAFSFALLAAIESLLSAVVADGMTGRRHRSNCELVAQGAANIGSALFGGICVTGLIARTATNIRAGAHGPASGMFHSLFILLFMLVAAPLARYIPLPALAGVLAIVAWNMVERSAVAALLRSSRGDALVLIVTFALVILRDLTTGIVVGFALGSLLFIGRMARSVEVQAHAPPVVDDRADDAGVARIAYDPAIATDPDTVIYRISGAFFFGAAATVASTLDRIADQPRNFVLDCSDVPFLDSTAANVIEGVAKKANRAGVRFIVAGASPQVRRMLITHGVRRPLAAYAPSVSAARAQLGEGRD
ncbi:SulP family inorganic anion transporter [Mesorhizobium sp. WSM4935]|uniref:SulP family inorganic anion transporter n=1 Tax=Mesorhizobium sp. WSM4935 TaxID=3038547 RepID=UPI002414F585|nr:SulP family inorganic anion transporter [Mesorhizobium sp. WSM4935]MDG4875292.1 SulP family inorganic anion transporter [Mesorhizobium sp. WSM4935]